MLRLADFLGALQQKFGLRVPAWLPQFEHQNKDPSRAPQEEKFEKLKIIQQVWSLADSELGAQGFGPCYVSCR